MVTDMEQHREGKSYTYDTLLELHQKYPDVQWYFITGADSLREFHKWYHWKELLDLCYFVVATRPGFSLQLNEEIQDQAQRARCGIILLEIDELDISSSEIRRRLQAGLDIRGMVPAVIEARMKNEIFLGE